ncbi:MAG: ParB/RepB/Spo0J family partition protein [Oscillospiraceae bacterium]|nr:ParB/RepB/Spo0J family partition protein [Oscillospiraceae bacterium]
MTGFAELFMTDEERKTQTLPRITDIPLELIDDFPNHPFKVRMDDDMQQLVESIKERGIITPVILRKKEEDGRYEIVSGHRRKKACEIAGLKMIKAEVREMTRDEAIIMMVDSNLQRSEILPSEKAFSYKMRLEAMKRQGARTDLTSSPVATKLAGKRSNEELGEMVGESKDQIRRYIRLTELDDRILDMVDEGKIGLRPAVELSYLTPKEQDMLVEAMEFADCTPSHAQAIRLRAFSRDGVLGPHIMENVMNEEKPNQKERITLRYDDARRYIPSYVPYNKTGEFIIKALEFYHDHLERQKGNRDAR